MNPDIFNKVNLGSVTETTNGEAFDTSRLSRSTVLISALTNGSGTGTGSQLFVTVDVSHNGSDWWTVDNRRYESGTARQKDTFGYEAHHPFMRTVAIGSNIDTMNVSTIITGRGV